MLTARYGRLTAVLALALCPAWATAAHLRGRIVRVGFGGTGRDATTTGTDHYRIGRWTPVRVELTNEDGDLFSGVIELRQSDRDGDEVLVRREVTVREPRTYYLYVPGGSYRSPNQFSVRVFDANGRLAPLFDDEDKPTRQLVPPRLVSPLPSESMVILDISAPLVGGLRKLLQDEKLAREPFLATASPPSTLPDSAAGLDIADIIVWDSADPSVIDVAQRDALIEWTRRGGTLVLGVGRDWQRLSRGKFSELLPAKLSAFETTDGAIELNPYLFGQRADPNSQPVRIDPPLGYCPVTVDSLAHDASPVLPPELPAEGAAQTQLFVTRRPCGRGQIVMVSAPLRELLARGTTGEPFLRQTLGLRHRTEAGDEDQDYYLGPADLFEYVERATGFQTTGAVYFLFAFVFVIAYIAVATLGSWSWLKRKGLIRHAWPAFAVVAVLASAASLGAVQVIRGIGKRVEELSVVDARADSAEAVASCYFGLKTASHTVLDVSVPTDWLESDAEIGAATLRPMPENADMLKQSVFSAEQRYEAVPDLAELRSVPLRATLKQFEATWRGHMPGKLEASLRRQSGSLSRLSRDSWIENDLGTDLHNAYLILPTRNFDEQKSQTQRAQSIFVYPVGDLAAGERVDWGTIESRIARKQGGTGRRSLPGMTEPAPATPVGTTDLVLYKHQEDWLRKATGRRASAYQDDDRERLIEPERFQSALLLLTVYEDIETDKLSTERWSVQRSRGQELDRSRFLTQDVALLVGFSSDPGPARICWRRPADTDGKWRPIHPSRANVMYRIAIPVEGS